MFKKLKENLSFIFLFSMLYTLMLFTRFDDDEIWDN